MAVLFLKAHIPMLGPGFRLINLALSADIAARNPLALAWRWLDHALGDFMNRQSHAA
jgi:hypothetical protein